MRIPVHPHMRGEHETLLWHTSGEYGSSPHAWGTLYDFNGRDVTRRFIPTCVGNTTSTVSFSRSMPVHPHMRGEHLCHSCTEGAYDGSSPHAWGTLTLRLHLGLRQRFIPTCVGNTSMGSLLQHLFAVHPHMR